MGAGMEVTKPDIKPETVKRRLSEMQAGALLDLHARLEAAKEAWAQGLVLAGVDPAKIVSGELGGSDPHFIVAE